MSWEISPASAAASGSGLGEGVARGEADPSAGARAAGEGEGGGVAPKEAGLPAGARAAGEGEGGTDIPRGGDETAAATVELTRQLGKTPVMVNKEIYGFIVNRILFEIFKEAFYLVNEGVASVEDIDVAMEGALGHPMGPFRTVDLLGVDLAHDILRDRYEETGVPRDAPPQFLADMVKAGTLGQKTGAGFYDYSEAKAKNK